MFGLQVDLSDSEDESGPGGEGGAGSGGAGGSGSGEPGGASGASGDGDAGMGRSRARVAGELGVNKKGTPLYSKEDIREQYCINDKELQVLDKSQRRTLLGCFSNQGQVREEENECDPEILE